ncbi:universal stress protein [Dactylosporangium roseum]|uniref:Universal stress protein n=1 Tax=Dactylosporangium roseum TaxID=47989 RepID=A0ABY5YXQ3_9ACTN|nr:universal stress protein [Dactylosporangium roseum]UWZ34156.1 universal stress protein [Dactylosporangium roseum]
MSTGTTVIVGVDGSPDSLRAVDWAAADALRRHRPLRIVHAFLWPAVYPPPALPVPPQLYEQTMREAAQQILDEAVTRARTVAPALDVGTDMPIQQAAAALVAASRHAATVVVGNRGLGGFTGLLLGSVGVELAAHAACPVVVVRHTDRPPGPEAGRVLVGVDGSHDAERALRFAFEQASFRGTGLTAVQVGPRPGTTGPDDLLPLVHDEETLQDFELRALAESVTGWVEKYPDVDVRRVAVRGRAAEVLTELSAGAELLVVGSRGRGGFTGLLLGSVSQAVIQHAACPVAVVR